MLSWMDRGQSAQSAMKHPIVLRPLAAAAHIHCKTDLVDSATARNSRNCLSMFAVSATVATLLVLVTAFPSVCLMRVDNVAVRRQLAAIWKAIRA